MNTRRIVTPTSHLRFGHGRADITPPVGIYHRMWGAARHDRATGVHRPLVVDALAFAPEAGAGNSAPVLRLHLDLVGLMREQYADLIGVVSRVTGLPPENVTAAFSHSHSAAYLAPNRVALPGGELILPFLSTVYERAAAAAREALGGLAPAIATYGTGCCAMNANRDAWDEERNRYVCGFNPGAPADDAVTVARMTSPAGELLATVVHYGCHPTSLAWENTLLSPDYPGAMRETVERETSAPCVFALGACGDLGPMRGFAGDPEVADRNGRELAYASLATLSAMGPAGADFVYEGPVVSGATLGCWSDAPLSAERRAESARFSFGSYETELKLKELPSPETLQGNIEQWEAEQRAADAAGDAASARDSGALAERARRWLGRVADLGGRSHYPVPFSILHTGDALWITCAGEPYSVLQTELRRRFPDHLVLVSPLAGPMEIAYLLPQEEYGKGLYQEEPSILAPGCLEALTGAISLRIGELPE
ncbi:MAG: hypothetical protein ACO1SX_27920 [Actinomycetota bacterium]